MKERLKAKKDNKKEGAGGKAKGKESGHKGKGEEWVVQQEAWLQLGGAQWGPAWQRNW